MNDLLPCNSFETLEKVSTADINDKFNSSLQHFH